MPNYSARYVLSEYGEDGSPIAIYGVELNFSANRDLIAIERAHKRGSKLVRTIQQEVELIDLREIKSNVPLRI